MYLCSLQVLDKYNQMKHKPPPRSYIGAVSFYEGETNLSSQSSLLTSSRPAHFNDFFFVYSSARHVCDGSLYTKRGGTADNASHEP